MGKLKNGEFVITPKDLFNGRPALEVIKGYGAEYKLTDAEMKYLLNYEENIYASTISRYLLAIGSETFEKMKAVYLRVTGEPYTKTDACGDCQRQLMEYIGLWYFGTKQKVWEENASVPKMVREGEKENAPRTKAPAKKGGKK